MDFNELDKFKEKNYLDTDGYDKNRLQNYDYNDNIGYNYRTTYKREDYKDNSSTRKKSSVFIRIWFYATIVAIFIVMGKTDGIGWALVLFGQLFAGISIVSIVGDKRKSEKSVGLAFPAIGIFVLISGIMMISGNAMPMEYFMRIFAVLVIGTIFFAGFSMAVIKPVCDERRKNRCTDAVRAVVVDVIKKHHSMDSGSTTSYTPVYEYYYEGNTYIKRSPNLYTINIPFVGRNDQIFVNPEKPTEIYIESNDKNVASRFMGIIIMLFSIMFMFAFIPQLFIK